MKNILFLSLIILFTGCTIKPNKVDINSYGIEFNTSLNNKNQIKENLLILKPRIAKSFDTKKIVYSIKPYAFESYGKNRWINLPSYMIKEALINNIENNKIFENVVDSYSNISSLYILQTDINKLYHKFEGEKSYAIIDIRFLLIKNREVLTSLSYKRKVLCDANTPYSFVKTLNETFNAVTRQLQKSLLSSL